VQLLGQGAGTLEGEVYGRLADGAGAMADAAVHGDQVVGVQSTVRSSKSMKRPPSRARKVSSDSG
jgi:hypothetical protein